MASGIRTSIDRVEGKDAGHNTNTTAREIFVFMLLKPNLIILHFPLYDVTSNEQKVVLWPKVSEFMALVTDSFF